MQNMNMPAEVQAMARGLRQKSKKEAAEEERPMAGEG